MFQHTSLSQEVIDNSCIFNDKDLNDKPRPPKKGVKHLYWIIKTSLNTFNAPYQHWQAQIFVIPNVYCKYLSKTLHLFMTKGILYCHRTDRGNVHFSMTWFNEAVASPIWFWLEGYKRSLMDVVQVFPVQSSSRFQIVKLRKKNAFVSFCLIYIHWKLFFSFKSLFYVDFSNFIHFLNKIR